MSKRVKILIPARLASKRLAGKVLADINGKPMLKRVIDQCARAAGRKAVGVVTPDRKIFDLVKEWGFDAYMSDPRSPDGTFAIASVVAKVPADHIVNVQADQPLIPVSLIRQMIRTLTRSKASVVTPVYRIKDPADIKDVGVAKVLRDLDGWALYFSRSPVPYCRDAGLGQWAKRHPYWGHYGIYGYTKKLLLRLPKLKKSYLEAAEKLEQIRFLQNGIGVLTFETRHRQLAVDTLADLKKIRRLCQ
ncbi:MAG: 3-deoxy-manno-octulosonate cytidylyltransferase [Candidatus Saganbacteria bacterium]|nr:3-deoxy-manno-octulosonate cytidylyltransferase [Candidatus Saganbacteria bacterium]